MDRPECRSSAAYCKFSSRIASLVARILGSTELSLKKSSGCSDDLTVLRMVFAMFASTPQSISCLATLS
jgi:hypothetical protein